MLGVGVDDYSYGKYVKHLLEWHSLTFHLLPDGVN